MNSTTRKFQENRMKDSYLKYLETSDIQNANEGGSVVNVAIKRFIDASNYPLEETFVESLGQCHAGELHLCVVLGPDRKLSSSLDLGLQEGLGEVSHGDAEQFGDLLGHCVIREESLVGVPLLFELQISKVENSRHDTEDS